MAGVKKKTYSLLPKDAKPIPNYPTYYATPNGEVWRKAPTKKTAFGIVEKRIIKLKDRYNPSNRYCQIQPYVDGKKTLAYTHRLVLAAFKGWPPEGFECNHIDCNTQNNQLSNLEWITKEKNLWLANQRPKATYKEGRKKHVHSKSKWKDIRPQVLNLRKKGKKVKEISLELGIPVEVVYYWRK